MDKLDKLIHTKLPALRAERKVALKADLDGMRIEVRSSAPGRAEIARASEGKRIVARPADVEILLAFSDDPRLNSLIRRGLE
jgi:hypothetical protein